MAVLSILAALGARPQVDPEAFYLEGLASYEAGAYEEAVDLLARASALGPGVPHYRYHLGLAYLKVGRPRDAAQEMEAALGIMGLKRETREQEPVVLVKAAIAYLQLGDLRTAKARAGLALRRGAGSASIDAHYVLGRAALEEGEALAALEHLSRAVEVDPHHVEANVALSEVLLREGRVEEAREALRRARAGAPGDLAVLLSMGSLALQEGDLVEAEEALREALALDPEDERAGLALGRVLLAAGRPEEAVAPLVLPAASSDEAALDLARAYAGSGRSAEARATLEVLLARRPGSADARLVLGLVLESEGDAAGAERLYRELLADRPAQAPAALQLAALLERSGRAEEAAGVLRALLEHVVDDEARRSIEEALALLPEGG